VKIHVTIAGRSYHMAEKLPPWMELPEGSSVDDALQHLAALMPAGTALDPHCLVAVSGAHLGTLQVHRPHTLCEGDELLVLAPVAGG
jgi:sulfur carrier protein ThiS